VCANPTMYSFGESRQENDKVHDGDDDEIDLEIAKDDPVPKKPNVALFSGLDLTQRLDSNLPENFFFKTPSHKDELDYFENLDKKKAKNIHL